MTNPLRKTAEMALSRLEHTIAYSNEEMQKIDEAKHALRQALAQPEQEPVAWLHEKAGGYRYYSWQKQYENDTPLYTAPPSIEAAVLAEREACAKVADEAVLQLNETANQLEDSEYLERCAIQGAMAQAAKLSKAIRARGEK